MKYPVHPQAAAMPPQDGQPWQMHAMQAGYDTVSGDQDSWVVSYMDVLTLLLTLFVLLLALQHYSPAAGHGRSAHETTEPLLREAAAPPVVTHEAQPVLTQSGSPAAPVTPVLIVSDEAESAPETSGSSPWYAASELYLPPSIAKLEWPMPAMSSVDTPMQVAESEPTTETIEAELTDAPPAAGHPAQALLDAVNNGPLSGRIDMIANADAVNLEISDSILFTPGRADLSPGGTALIAELAGLLNMIAAPLSVEGHTDNVPIHNTRFPSNWELSTARATAVTRALMTQGVTATRLRAIGYADTRPRDDNETAVGRERNRRVSLVLHLSGGEGVAARESQVGVR